MPRAWASSAIRWAATGRWCWRNAIRTASARCPPSRRLPRRSKCPWGVKAFSGYLGNDPVRWAEHDASELMTGQDAPPFPRGILIDQGLADRFLAEQLHPEAFEAACKVAGQPLTLRRHAGYDHGYYFISTFIEEFRLALPMRSGWQAEAPEIIGDGGAAAPGTRAPAGRGGRAGPWRAAWSGVSALPPACGPLDCLRSGARSCRGVAPGSRWPLAALVVGFGLSWAGRSPRAGPAPFAASRRAPVGLLLWFWPRLRPVRRRLPDTISGPDGGGGGGGRGARGVARRGGRAESRGAGVVRVVVAAAGAAGWRRWSVGGCGPSGRRAPRGAAVPAARGGGRSAAAGVAGAAAPRARRRGAGRGALSGAAAARGARGGGGGGRRWLRWPAPVSPSPGARPVGGRGRWAGAGAGARGGLPGAGPRRPGAGRRARSNTELRQPPRVELALSFRVLTSCECSPVLSGGPTP